jgi:hypothetical protein
MPPTKAMIDSWEFGCKDLTLTENAWKAMLSTDLVAFNSLLTKNGLTPLKLTPTGVSAPASCTFAWPAPATGGRKKN